MTKQEVLALIDAHKNKLIHPVELLDWTWLRVIILQIPDEEWDTYVGTAVGVMSR